MRTRKAQAEMFALLFFVFIMALALGIGVGNSSEKNRSEVNAIKAKVGFYNGTTRAFEFIKVGE